MSNFSFYDFLINNADNGGQGHVVPVTEERPGLKELCPALFSLDPQMLRMLHDCNADGVEAMLRGLMTNTQVAMFGDLVERVYREREAVQGAEALRIWAGRNAPAAFAASPYKSSHLCPEKKIPGAEGLHRAPPNTLLREALRPPISGSFKVGDSMAIIGMLNGSEVPVCGPVDLVKFGKLRYDRKVRPLHIGFLEDMQVMNFVAGEVDKWVAERKLTEWKGGPVGELVIHPRGRVYASAGIVPEEVVCGVIQTQRQFISIGCDVEECFEWKGDLSNFYFFALTTGSFRCPYVLTGAFKTEWPREVDKQFLNRCFRNNLQQLSSRGAEHMEVLLETLNRAQNSPLGEVNRGISEISAASAKGLPLPRFVKRSVAESEVSVAPVTRNNEKDRDLEVISQLLLPVPLTVSVKGSEGAQTTSKKLREWEREMSEDAQKAQAMKRTDPYYLTVRHMRERDLDLPGMQTGDLNQADIRHGNPEVKKTVFSNNGHSVGLRVSWKKDGCPTKLPNESHFRKVHTPKTIPDTIFLGSAMRVSAPLNVVPYFNTLWKIKGVVKGGDLCVQQVQSREAFGAYLASVAMAPHGGCVLYGSVRVLPDWWHPEDVVHPDEAQRTLMVRIGVMFVKVGNDLCSFAVLGVDNLARVHGKVICSGVTPHQVVAYTLAALPSLDTPGARLPQGDCGMLWRVYGMLSAASRGFHLE